MKDGICGRGMGVGLSQEEEGVPQAPVWTKHTWRGAGPVPSRVAHLTILTFPRDCLITCVVFCYFQSCRLKMRRQSQRLERKRDQLGAQAVDCRTPAPQGEVSCLEAWGAVQVEGPRAPRWTQARPLSRPRLRSESSAAGAGLTSRRCDVEHDGPCCL